MLRRHIVLLIVFRSLDGDVKPGGPHPNLNFLQHTIQILVSHVMWSVQAVRELKIDHTHLAWNLKHVIVQWVGIGTHTHTFTTFQGLYQWAFVACSGDTFCLNNAEGEKYRDDSEVCPCIFCNFLGGGRKILK